MTQILPERHPHFPTGSVCTRILFDFILATHLGEAERVVCDRLQDSAERGKSGSQDPQK